MMESLPLCEDVGEFGQRPGRTPDTATPTYCPHRPCHPNTPNYPGLVDGTEFRIQMLA
jgi:hypothetical protein